MLTVYFLSERNRYVTCLIPLASAGTNIFAIALSISVFNGPLRCKYCVTWYWLKKCTPFCTSATIDDTGNSPNGQKFYEFPFNKLFYLKLYSPNLKLLTEPKECVSWFIRKLFKLANTWKTLDTFYPRPNLIRSMAPAGGISSSAISAELSTKTVVLSAILLCWLRVMFIEFLVQSTSGRKNVCTVNCMPLCSKSNLDRKSDQMFSWWPFRESCHCQIFEQPKFARFDQFRTFPIHYFFCHVTVIYKRPNNFEPNSTVFDIDFGNLIPPH